MQLRATRLSATDQAVLAALFAEHAPAMYRVAVLCGVDYTGAEDVVQEAFARLAPSLHRIREPENRVAYLRRIVVNQSNDHNRRGLMSLRHHPPADPEPLSVEEHVVGRDVSLRVVAALRNLPTRQRHCIVLRHYLDLSIAEIAHTLGISANSVKKHLQRAKETLRIELEPGEESDRQEATS
jgi:RNA polymerase sigma-70 factor (sigma-E family)